MPKDRKVIGLTLPKDMADDIETRAKSMGFSSSKYCRIVLSNWLESGDKLTIEEKTG